MNAGRYGDIAQCHVEAQHLIQRELEVDRRAQVSIGYMLICQLMQARTHFLRIIDNSIY